MTKNKLFKKKTSILIVTQHFYPDFAATGQLLFDLSKKLAQKDFKISVFTAMPFYKDIKRTSPSKEIINDVKIFRTKITKFWIRSIFGRSINGIIFCIKFFTYIIFKKRNKLIIYTTAPVFLPIVGYFISKVSGLSYVAILYDIYPQILSKLKILHEKNLLIKMWHKLNYLMIQDAKEIIVLSEDMKNTICSYNRDFDRKVKIIKSWSNDKNIKKIEKQNNWFLEENNLKNKFVILYSGNQGRCHDLKTIIDTAYHLRKEKEIVFLFIGNGFYNKKLKTIKKDKKLNNCIFLPYQKLENLSYSLSSADIALVTIKKGFEAVMSPSKLFGHLAIGTPIALVTSSNSELRETIKKYKFGKWFKNGESNKLAEWILSLKNEPKLMVSIGENSLNYLKKNATSEIISKQYANLLCEYVES